MGVLIKGIDLPEAYGQAILTVYECIDGRAIPREYKLSAMQMQAIPPHGRLIDADRTIDKAEMLMKEPSRETVDFMTIGYNHAVADCIAICKGVPTIIGAEE